MHDRFDMSYLPVIAARTIHSNIGVRNQLFFLVGGGGGGWRGWGLWPEYFLRCARPEKLAQLGEGGGGGMGVDSCTLYRIPKRKEKKIIYDEVRVISKLLERKEKKNHEKLSGFMPEYYLGFCPNIAGLKSPRGLQPPPRKHIHSNITCVHETSTPKGSSL